MVAMIEAQQDLSEELRLLKEEQEAKIKQAEFLLKKGMGVFGSLRKDSEHYGRLYGEALGNLTSAYRLAYESADFETSMQSPEKRRAQSVMEKTGEFCQMRVPTLVIGTEKVKLPGLTTVKVEIKPLINNEI